MVIGSSGSLCTWQLGFVVSYELSRDQLTGKLLSFLWSLDYLLWELVSPLLPQLTTDWELLSLREKSVLFFLCIFFPYFPGH